MERMDSWMGTANGNNRDDNQAGKLKKKRSDHLIVRPQHYHGGQHFQSCYATALLMVHHIPDTCW